MIFNIAHNITSKLQSHTQGNVASHGVGVAMSNQQIVPKTSYKLLYEEHAQGSFTVPGQDGDVSYVQPHAPQVIKETPDAQTYATDHPAYREQHLDYDANGNMLSIKLVVNHEDNPDVRDGVVQQEQTLLSSYIWDEENRLRAVNMNPEEPANNQIAVYTYDASGQRVVRHIPSRLDVHENASTRSIGDKAVDVLYPSPLLTAQAITKDGNASPGEPITSYTKHYYMDATRVASTLGTVKDLGLYPMTEKGFTKNLVPIIRPLANTATQTAQTALLNTYAALGQTGNTPTPVVEGDLNSFNHDYLEDGARTYWYHPDHLGSSSYITNVEGIVTQHMEYMPYGEPSLASSPTPKKTIAKSGQSLVEEHQNSINTPYKFNGKEQDDETGNYYYGARYYNPKFSFWLSVDPLAEKMPEWSSYAYAFNNPVMYTDPTGMEPDGVDPPTNSVQINSHIQAIRDQYPDAPIYLMVQTGMDEAQAREAAGSPNSLSYDRYTIQEGTDYSNGSFIVSLMHGENKITGSIISTSQVNEVEKSYMLTFEKGNMPKTGNKVGGADTLDNKSSNLLNDIVQIINSTGQSLNINASVASKTNEMPSAETMVWGLINGNVQKKSFREFGEQRISTVINSLTRSGANRNLLNSGGVSYSAGGNGRPTGTYLDFKFSSPMLRNSNRRSSTGTIQLNKGKFQIF